MMTQQSGKPPRHLRHCASTVSFQRSQDSELDIGGGNTDYVPVYRSGSFATIGPKRYMEDEHICIDTLEDRVPDLSLPGAFYGVFDGHGGTDAAEFVRDNILNYIIEDRQFELSMENAMKSAFLRTDHAFASTSSLDSSSGTTALAAIILGRTIHVANAGDCRAVLGRRGRAVDLSRDHKPTSMTERARIEDLGGTIYDGYLNGQLSITRAIGDWHVKGPVGSSSPLTAEPELNETVLTEEDEFMIIGCDGIWDVMSSQCAVRIARRELVEHNDPEMCAKEIVREATRRNACDNLTVVIVCFSRDPPAKLDMGRSRFRRSISAESLNFLKGVLDSN